VQRIGQGPLPAAGSSVAMSRLSVVGPEVLPRWWFLAGACIAAAFTIPDLWWQAQHFPGPDKPQISRAFAEYVQDRGFLIDPARVRRPRLAPSGPAGCSACRGRRYRPPALHRPRRSAAIQDQPAAPPWLPTAAEPAATFPPLLESHARPARQARGRRTPRLRRRGSLSAPLGGHWNGTRQGCDPAVRQPARVHVAGRTDDDEGVSMAAPMAWRRLGAERKLSGGGQCEPG